MEQKKSSVIFKITGIGFVIFLALAVVVIAYVIKSIPGSRLAQSLIPSSNSDSLSSAFGKFKQFTSEGDFKTYLAESSSEQNFGTPAMSGVKNSMALPNAQPLDLGQTSQAQPERVSATNVQVLGIDEPDIVKTNGSDLFYSSRNSIVRPVPLLQPDTGTSLQFPGSPGQGMLPYPAPDPYRVLSVHIFPPDSMAFNAPINTNGDLLLYKNFLVVFSQNSQPNGITGYDISKTDNPREVWNIRYKDNTSYIQARLFGQKLYLITRTTLNNENPCPIIPYSDLKQPVSVRCTDIYHPSVPVGTDSIFTVSRIDPGTGSLEKTVAFTGSSAQQSVIYMSQDNLYVAYPYQADYLKTILLFTEENPGIFPESIVARLKNLETYDISKQAKMVELQVVLSGYLAAMDYDARVTFQNRLANKESNFLSEHARDLEKTGIVKIPIPDLNVAATGNVPGKPLNQFSVDEFGGNLRIATTISRNVGSWFGYLGGSEAPQSFSDVYVLNQNLDITGSVKDLGKGEEIYSVRFIHDRGYVVTFRQTDPFYVIDLSSTTHPYMAGELKIPGYSAYLHPLSERLILGVGRENQQVKVSLFDVTSAGEPKEIDKFLLDEYWSDILNTHHAFLADEQRQIFFIPGSKAAYLFSYKGNKLNLVKAFQAAQVSRAVYVNNYLYILSDSGITAIDENSWNRVKELSF